MHGRSRLWILGHSLGGALAVMFASYMPTATDVVSTMTYGQPRVGNHAFVVWFESRFRGRYTRITTRHDPVPRLPGQLFAYEHAAPEVYYPTSHIGQYRMCTTEEDTRCSDHFPMIMSNVMDHLTYFGFRTLYPFVENSTNRIHTTT